MSKPHQTDSPELNKLKDLIQTPLETELHLHNVNSRLRNLFGGTAVSNLCRRPKFLIGMPFKEVYQPVHKIIPAVEHRTYVRNDGRNKDAVIQVLSPFTTAGSKYPLLEVSFFPETPVADPFISFEIRPIEDANTIYCCVMRQADIMKSGEIMLALSDVRL